MISLHSVLLKLVAQHDATIAATQGHHAYALFLDMMSRSGPKIANDLHEAAEIKPFTISSLLGEQKPNSKSISIVAGASYFLRVTFLNDDLFSHFMDAVLKSAGRPIMLESAVFTIGQLLIGKNDSPHCGHISYEKLADEAKAGYEIDLAFLSPVAFRSAGKRNVVLPEPQLVFGSYLNKWKRIAPLKIEESMSSQFSSVSVSRYRLRTTTLDFKDYQETGFEGKCKFKLPDKLSATIAKAFNLLASFSFYCGTGAKTTMGMGQTRLLK